jgi:sugar/nucleoside kinase (ribokinase family)
MKRHIIIIGDVYIDHDIFVTELESRRVSGTVEQRFEVVRRQDTAGGAANSARILSVINDGDTYLWGALGSSHWGTFREILEESHAVDAAHRPIELRGVRDETDPPMNTVTRILVVDEDQPRLVKQRFCRYYDVDHVHITEAKRETVLYHLERIQEKSPLHAILINDFERGTLTQPIIEAISARAARYSIPLFLDPRSDRARYVGMKGTAILPNLHEWCELVGITDTGAAERFRKNLGNPATLREMAVLSFRHLGNFEYHIIKCDSDGAVLFFPDEHKRHLYALYHVPPVAADHGPATLQVGCGDVMAAVFAFEFPQDAPEPGAVLRAFQRANAAVACYREMPWHQMPPRRAIEQKQKKFTWSGSPPDASITKGVLFLPQRLSVVTSVCETAVPGLFSQDQAFKVDVQTFIEDVTNVNAWAAGSIKSLVLGAPPGTGKTTIMKAIRNMGPAHGFGSEDMSSTADGTGGMEKWSPAEFREIFRGMRDRNKDQRLLILVDEALREPVGSFLKQNAPTLLNAAHAESIRFLFISAGFRAELENEPELRELFGRTRTHYLSDLGARPFDIPYIIAARFFERLPMLDRLEIDGKFLLAVTDLALEVPEPRTVCDVVDEVLNGREVTEPAFRVSFLEHLPKRYSGRVSMPRGDFDTYEFRR